MTTIPWSVNPTNSGDYSRTNTPTWWNGGTNFLGIVPGQDYSLGVPAWMAWQAVNDNYSRIVEYLSTNTVAFTGDATGSGAGSIAVTVSNVRGVLTNNISGTAAAATNTPAGLPVASVNDLTSATNNLWSIVLARSYLTTNSTLSGMKLVATNSPTVGDAYRYDGTNFYWGP